MVSRTKLSSATLGILLSTALVAGATAPASAGAVESSPHDSTLTAVPANENGDIPTITESELAELGLTRADAEALEAEFESVVNEAEAAGTISAEEASVLREELGQPPAGGGDMQTQALPVWAAAAIVGCAGAAVMGSGKTQIQNALKSGATVDQAADIAIDTAVDCVFGAVPGGAIGAAAQRTLSGPIKSALRPHVKRSVENLDN